jgi:hypothetical protein
MTIKIALATFFTCIVSLSTAQQTKTLDLKPIHHQGFSYYYDFKRVDGGAYGLQIPLQGLGDEEVNRRYKKFKSLRTVEAALVAVPIVYLVTYIPESRHGHLNMTTFWTVYGISLAAILGVEIAAKHQLKKGVDRYNELILAPGTASLGATLTYKFY